MQEGGFNLIAKLRRQGRGVDEIRGDCSYEPRPVSLEKRRYLPWLESTLLRELHHNLNVVRTGNAVKAKPLHVLVTDFALAGC